MNNAMDTSIKPKMKVISTDSINANSTSALPSSPHALFQRGRLRTARDIRSGSLSAREFFLLMVTPELP
jgi:hypothetical protein